jgi:Fe-S-cluster-containing hydrogenase component 2
MVFSQPCYRCRQCRWVCSSGWVRCWYVLMIFVED